MSATPVEPSLRHAAHPIAVVRHWLASSLSSASDPPPAIAALIGLGPGLTPSGDDFLGGVLAALHYLGHAEVADRLAHLVLPIAAENTSLISAAYLRAAAAGEVAKVLYDTLDAVLAGDNASLERQLDAIGAVGHTSGWDALAGAVVVCSARAK